MAKVRKIPRNPEKGRNYYVVDACFLANRRIPKSFAPPGRERDRIDSCVRWWAEIDAQLSSQQARVYVPDICIAEAFKVLAKKYYVDGWFDTWAKYDRARDKLSDDIRIPAKDVQRKDREVPFHDVSTNRDIIVGVDRFFRLFMNNKKKVSLPDLVLVATAKYLMEIFDLPKERTHIVTMDKPLREGVGKTTELPNAYDPTLVGHRADVVFFNGT